MTLDERKNELLDEFREYLEHSRLEQAAEQETVDLATLLAEMASLRTEVKAESRQFKTTLETLSTALGAVQEDNKTLAAELASKLELQQQREQEILRAVLLDIVDLYDRLRHSFDVMERYRPVEALFKRSHDKDVRFIASLKEGQTITLRRFDQLLQNYQIRPMECVGRLLDPVTMSAVETAQDPNVDNGVVIEELRTGFLFRDQVLRLAEVKVNKVPTR
ncbi:MAG: nucleotide exchange factor GrpE [Gammaproteobacteria bacterium]